LAVRSTLVTDGVRSADTVPLLREERRTQQPSCHGTTVAA
jgi:hypothetical protein